MVGQDTNRDFIGRELEIAFYEKWLDRSKGPWILYFHDAFTDPNKKGGIGKTWLLRKCVELTQQRYPATAIVPVDFFNVEDRNGVVIAERVINQLKAMNPRWSPEASEAILTEYREAKKSDTDDVTPQRKLADAIANDLSSLDRQLQKTGRYLLIFYDTFELIEKDPVVALLNPNQKFPDNYQFAHIGVVMAGRNVLPLHDPDSYWYGREQEVLEVPLGPFSLEEMVDYINVDKRSILATQVADSREMKLLHERTEGRPILIGLVTDIVNNRVLTLEDLLNVSPHTFEGYLVSKISNLEDPINWIILFMAHAYHRFNATILDWMFQELDLFKGRTNVKYQDLLQKLPTLSFVRHSITGNDFILHDEMRRLVIRYCWEQQQDPHKVNRIEVSNCMIKYYEKALAQEKNKLMAQSYTVEMLYHKLFVNLDNGLKFFEETFRNAIKLWSRSYARSLLQEAQKFTLSQQQGYRLVVLEARLLLREENPRRALTLYQYLQAEADKDWFNENCSTVYYGLAECFLSLGNFSEAIENAKKSLEMEQRVDNKQRQAELLGGTLGYIRQRQGEFDDAVEYYKQSLAIYKRIRDRREYADKMNSLGNVYRIQGKIDEALRCCQVALQIREELFKQEEVGELQKGLSLSTIGMIYLDNNDVLQAEDCFQKASEIFQRSGYRRGIARTYNRLGRTQELKGDLDGAMKYFQDAYEVALSVDAQEEQISSLNKQGSVLMRQENLAKARERFEQARELSGQIQDYYQQVESLIALAEVFEFANMRDESQLHLERARELALQHRYYSLLGSADNFQGVMRYQQKDYGTAFNHFVRSCHYMALFNSLSYNEAIRSLVERLLQIPEDSRSGIISMIRAYWSENDLDTMYPELVRACQEVEELAF